MDDDDETAIMDSGALRAGAVALGVPQPTEGLDGVQVRAVVDAAASNSLAADHQLHQMHQKRVIDTGQYLAASAQQRVQFKHPRFEHLPERSVLYQLLGALDEGGMGEVRIARDPYLDRKVAVKLIKLEKMTDLNVERFIREAQVTAKLDHPNVIPIYSLHSEDDGRASFAMKLIHGLTITEVVMEVRAELEANNKEPVHWTLRRRLEMFLRICDAMGYAHDMGVVHRDLKPANIMVGEYNEVYVMDWGLAKIDDEPETEATSEMTALSMPAGDGAQTQAGALLGTPLYMPPEQAAGRPDLVGRHSDIYSLGAILYELVALKRMISASKIIDVLMNVIEGRHEAIEPYKDAYTIAPELAGIIKKACHLVPEGRYASVADFAADLRRYLDDEEVEAHPDTLVRGVQRWMAHNRGKTFGLIILLISLAAGVTITSLVEQNIATKRQQVEQRQLSELQTLVSERAHAVDSQFLRFELLVNRLAVATTQLLLDGAPVEGALYSSADYDEGRGPADYKESKVYGKKVSIEHPVFKPAPGVDMQELDPTLRKLLPLSVQFRSIFMDSRLSDAPLKTAKDRWKAIAVDGVPGRWAFVGLANGVHVSYPGKGGYSAEYDPRKRPWYAQGKGQTSPKWGDPYVDSQGQGLVLPCVVGVIADGEELGVAGFEVALAFAQATFMEPMGPVTETFVLDGEGRILITSLGSSQELQVEDVKDLPSFDVAVVASQIASGRSGVRIDRSGDASVVYVVSRLPTLGWFYVASAPLDAVLSAPGGPE